MIKLTYADLNNRIFTAVLDKLDNYRGFTSGEMYNYNRLKTAWDTESKTGRDLFQKILDKHCAKDDQGKLKEVEIESGGKKWDLADEAAFQADVKEMLEQTFEVKFTPFKFDSLAKAGLSPREMRIIEVLIQDPRFEEDSSGQLRPVPN